jgi:UDP-N-acetylmuramate dehydrogenase
VNPVEAIGVSTNRGFERIDDASLRELTTFRVAARARKLINVFTAEALTDVLASPSLLGGELLILGGGSNILFTRDWPGTVLALRTRGIAILDDDGEHALLRCAAGEVWNDLVLWSLAHGLCGLENLALIPGSVGASPIQNIGAYGTEVGEFVYAVLALDRTTHEPVRFSRDECAFGYRDSLFKQQPGRYLITAVEFLLPRQRELRLDYAGLREELGVMGIDQPDARAVAEAVSRVRTRKLPDPQTTGNAGSFFKNPIVPAEQAHALKQVHPALPIWPQNARETKLSAAWLIEACGYKGLREGDAGVAEQHSLVLVNYGTATGAQLWALAQRVVAGVQARFDVRLEAEPTVI